MNKNFFLELYFDSINYVKHNKTFPLKGLFSMYGVFVILTQTNGDSKVLKWYSFHCIISLNLNGSRAKRRRGCHSTTSHWTPELSSTKQSLIWPYIKKIEIRVMHKKSDLSISFQPVVYVVYSHGIFIHKGSWSECKRWRHRSNIPLP